MKLHIAIVPAALLLLIPGCVAVVERPAEVEVGAP